MSATDAVGVTAISFAATGTVSASETRPISPAATSRSETFTVNITPLPAADGSLTFTATAPDDAGTPGEAGPWVTIERANGVKCERCWRYVPAVSSEPATAGLAKSVTVKSGMLTSR